MNAQSARLRCFIAAEGLAAETKTAISGWAASHQELTFGV